MQTPTPETDVSSEAFLALMRHVPSPVTVVTAVGPEGARGMTAGSFTSVSLDPLLVSLNVIRASQMHTVLEDASHFAVHILAEHQAEWSEHFAVPDLTGERQFEHIPHQLDPRGVPLLDGTLGIIYCRKYAVYEAGDHSIVIGEVLSVLEGSYAGPLLYYGRSYYNIGKEIWKVVREEG